MARRRNEQVDDRTAEMPLAALTCRTYGHPWIPAPQGSKRRTELFKLGQTEEVVKCGGCGAVKTQLIDLDSWEVISARMEYPEGYLIPKTTFGRLPRSEARKARFYRTFA